MRLKEDSFKTDPTKQPLRKKVDRLFIRGEALASIARHLRANIEQN